VKRTLRQFEPHAVALRVKAFVRILRNQYAHEPKGMSLGPSRFSSPSGAFRVLYAAQDFSTALAEAIIRDRFVDREHRYIGRSTLATRSVTLIGTMAPLKMLDVRGSAAYTLGIDTNAVRGRTHDPGQAFSEWLHAVSNFDGLLYDSRLDHPRLHCGLRARVAENRRVAGTTAARAHGPRPRATAYENHRPQALRISAIKLWSDSALCRLWFRTHKVQVGEAGDHARVTSMS